LSGKRLWRKRENSKKRYKRTEKRLHARQRRRGDERKRRLRELSRSFKT
jgi:hypothetical protein